MRWTSFSCLLGVSSHAVVTTSTSCPTSQSTGSCSRSNEDPPAAVWPNLVHVGAYGLPCRSSTPPSTTSSPPLAKVMPMPGDSKGQLSEPKLNLPMTVTFSTASVKSGRSANTSSLPALMVSEAIWTGVLRRYRCPAGSTISAVAGICSKGIKSAASCGHWVCNLWAGSATGIRRWNAAALYASSASAWAEPSRPIPRQRHKAWRGRHRASAMLAKSKKATCVCNVA
mmetsp:Transcript_14944/g.37896  ORF Transcript_14944/g.37896 Transcript_14944/m.37896 type:complete len:227 (-) Transcript_14944:3-683(-)